MRIFGAESMRGDTHSASIRSAPRPPREVLREAGEGDRTLIDGLEGHRSTIELRPRTHRPGTTIAEPAGGTRRPARRPQNAGPGLGRRPSGRRVPGRYETGQDREDSASGPKATGRVDRQL